MDFHKSIFYILIILSCILFMDIVQAEVIEIDEECDNTKIEREITLALGSTFSVSVKCKGEWDVFSSWEAQDTPYGVVEVLHTYLVSTPDAGNPLEIDGEGTADLFHLGLVTRELSLEAISGAKITIGTKVQ